MTCHRIVKTHLDFSKTKMYTFEFKNYAIIILITPMIEYGYFHLVTILSRLF